MSNLEMINAAFGVNLNLNPFSGKKRTEAEVLVREAHRVGAYWCKPSPSSTTALAYRSPKCLYGAALFLALDGDDGPLRVICEANIRLEKVRIAKETELKKIRGARIEDLEQDRKQLGEAFGQLCVGVQHRFQRAQTALSSALRKEVELLIDAWGQVEPMEDAQVGAYWEQYYRAENQLKESLHYKISVLRDKFSG